LNAHALGCGRHPACDFAAVGNEYFFEHDRPATFLNFKNSICVVICVLTCVLNGVVICVVICAVT